MHCLGTERNHNSSSRRDTETEEKGGNGQDTQHENSQSPQQTQAPRTNFLHLNYRGRYH